MLSEPPADGFKPDGTTTPGMFLYRLQRFLDAWREEDALVRAFLLWSGTNTIAAFALLVGSFSLFSVLSTPGFQGTLLFGYIAVAVAWTLSIFLIGPAYDRFGPDAS